MDPNLPSALITGGAQGIGKALAQEFLGAGRIGTPKDVAALALYLASPEAGFITGQNFVVDGGMTRKMIYAE